MAVIPKSKVIQLRVEPELFDKFSARADLNDTTVSALIRGLMKNYVHQVEQRERKDAEWAATLESRRQAASAAAGVQLPPVVSVRVPQSLSERRKAEKLAKDARKARKAE